MSNKQTPPLFAVEAVKAVGMQTPVDIVLEQGDICMLSGLSGSGKSQFLKALADLIEHSGKVALAGDLQLNTSPEKWRSQVMYFAAETAWWLDDVRAHFKTEPTAEQLQHMALKPKIMHSPIDNLSSGEKQRLALLRGLQYQPKVLLLDEITANLDLQTETRVEVVLQDYIQAFGATAIWINHNTAQIQRMATKTLRFKNELFEQEPHTQPQVSLGDKR